MDSYPVRADEVLWDDERETELVGVHHRAQILFPEGAGRLVGVNILGQDLERLLGLERVDKLGRRRVVALVDDRDRDAGGAGGRGIDMIDLPEEVDEREGHDEGE